MNSIQDLWKWFLEGREAEAAKAMFVDDVAWDDPLNDAAKGEGVFTGALPRLAQWYRDRAVPGASVQDTIAPLLVTADEQRVVFEHVHTLRDGLIWDQALQKATKAERFEFATACVAQRAKGASKPFGALRIYFGTWAVLDGTPRKRIGPISPDETAATRDAIHAMPVVRRYLEALAVGDPKIIDTFEPDGYFREPANNFACGGDQVRAHFEHILTLGGVGVEFRTATRQADRIGLELQTVKWGTKQMDAPQAGFAIYELGHNGKIARSRVYDSVVPPAF